MRLIRAPVALPLACLFLVLGCSKTEDVAPERKIFGNPPTIVNFRILNPDLSPATSPLLPQQTVTCNITRTVELGFCQSYGVANKSCSDGSGACDPFVAKLGDPCHYTCDDGSGNLCESNQAFGDRCGLGGFCRWGCSDGTGACSPLAKEGDFCNPPFFLGTCGAKGRCEILDLSDMKASPAVVISGSYTQVIFEAEVDDPDTKRDEEGRITENNILLVASSFVLPADKSEVTLVLFDDGGTNVFPQPDKAPSGIPADCRIDENGHCKCDGKIFQVTSNDGTKDDLLYTRAFAIANNSTSGWLQNCIMQEKRQALSNLQPGSRLSFRIDAVDKQGNLDTWEQTPEIIVDVDKFECMGDACGCCLIRSNDPGRDCKDLTGMIATNAPNGLCVDLL